MAESDPRKRESSQTSSPGAAPASIKLRAELAGGPRTGMRPVDGDDGLDYTQTWEIAVGRVTTP